MVKWGLVAIDDSPGQIADLVLLVHSSGWALVEGPLTVSLQIWACIKIKQQLLQYRIAGKFRGVKNSFNSRNGGIRE